MVDNFRPQFTCLYLPGPKGALQRGDRIRWSFAALHMSLPLALSGSDAMSDISPLSGVKRKCR